MSLKMSDIARIAHVSKATVSLVLNEQPGVSESTRQRIKKLWQISIIHHCAKVDGCRQTTLAKSRY
jgi:Transcriptional regulators